MQDFEELYSILSDKITMRFWAKPFSAEKILRRIEMSLSTYDTSGFGKFAVVLKETGKLIGDCGITIVEADDVNENNLGYIIQHEFHGKGYGTEAAKACVSYALDVLQLKRLTANMAAVNKASIKVAEKSGMAFEKEFLDKKNRNLLTYLYSITI
jgi:[ribosomal protein S5]-alanine N-acetyltransferase